MKKQLILTKIGDEYLLSMKDDENINIRIVNKVLSGEDIYVAFYENLTEKIEYEIENNFSEHEDKIIANQLINLINKIDTEVNKNCFNDSKEGE